MNSWCYLLIDSPHRTRGPGAGAYFGRKPDLCHRDFTARGRFPPGVCRARVVLTVVPQYRVQRPRLDAGAQPAHELEVVMQVVDGVEARAEDLVAAIEMAQVGAREIATGVAGAGRIERPRVGVVGGVADVHHALRGEQVTVARMARRHHAVEHVDTAQHGCDDVLRASDAHQIA